MDQDRVHIRVKDCSVLDTIEPNLCGSGITVMYVFPVAT